MAVDQAEVPIEEVPDAREEGEFTLAQIVRELSIPFRPHEIQKRKQAGRDLSYITARQARGRADKVLLPKGWHWEMDYNYHAPDAQAKTGGFAIGITIVDPKGNRYGPRWDVGGFPGMPSAEDNFKGGFSDSLKRAWAEWGVGAHLYEEGYFGDDEPGAKQGSKVAGPASPPPRPQAPPPQQPRSQAPPPRQQAPEPGGPDDQVVAGQGFQAPDGLNLDGGEPGKAFFAWFQELDKKHGKPGGKPRFAHVQAAMKQLGVSKPVPQLDRGEIVRILDICGEGIAPGKTDAPSDAREDGGAGTGDIIRDLLSGPPRYVLSWARKLEREARWPAVDWIVGQGGWAERTQQRKAVDDWDASTVSQCYFALLIALQADRPEVVGKARLGAARIRVEQAARDLFNVKMLAAPGDALPCFADAHGSGPRTLGELKSWQDGNALNDYAETAESVVTAYQIPDSSARDGIPKGPVSQNRDDQVSGGTDWDRARRDLRAEIEAGKGSKAKRR